MNLQLVSAQSVDGLTVAQLLAEPKDSLDYLTAPRALAAQHIRVTEVDSAGRVNSLRVENLSDHFVFLMDGDVLRGAKQDRVLNTSIFLAPHSVTIVPVSCVEAGRWRSVSRHLQVAACASPASLRRLKSGHLYRRAFANPADFQANQGEVWDAVAALKAKLHAHAPTDSLHDVYTDKQATWADTLCSLQPAPGANGMAIWFGDRLVSMDLFNRADALADYFPRLLRGVMLDWFGATIPPRQADLSTLTTRLRENLDRALAATLPPRPAVGAGTERRFDTPDAVGFALDYETHRIHLNLMGKGH